MRKQSSIIIGCMRLAGKTPEEMARFIHTASDCGLSWYDHADIYGQGQSEWVFGEALARDSSIRREDLIIQSKCGICKGYYDLSKEHIIESVEGILTRLKTDYLDILLLHRPDALVEPEEVAAAFDELETSGKVRAFGVSNHKPSQIELLKKYVRQELMYNQLQFSLAVSNMVANGMEVNMETAGSYDHDGSVLDYCRIHDITIQAWSPFQKPGWKGVLIGDPEYAELNQVLNELSVTYDSTPTTLAAAWILRHPAGIQIITGTANEDRLREISAAESIELSREDWYRMYLAAGHILP